MKEILRHAAQGGGAAPQRQADGQYIAPRTLVRHTCDGNAEKGIESSEGDAPEKTHHGVRDLQVLFDGLHQNAEYRAIDEIENVNDYQQTEGVGTVGGGERACFRLTHVRLSARCRLAESLPVGPGLLKRCRTDFRCAADVTPTACILGLRQFQCNGIWGKIAYGGDAT